MEVDRKLYKSLERISSLEKTQKSKRRKFAIGETICQGQ